MAAIAMHTTCAVVLRTKRCSTRRMAYFVARIRSKATHHSRRGHVDWLGPYVGFPKNSNICTFSHEKILRRHSILVGLHIKILPLGIANQIGRASCRERV